MSPDTQQTLMLGGAATLVLIPALGFFLRWMLGGFEKRLDAMVAEVRSIAASVASHETRLALVEQRSARGEADISVLRDRKHELGTEIQALQFRVRALERTTSGEHRKVTEADE